MADPYDPRAKGLSGEILDAMLKAAFTEGVLAEREVQQAAGQQAVEAAHADALKRGEVTGEQRAIREHAGAAYGRGYQHAHSALVELMKTLRDPARLDRKDLLRQCERIGTHLDAGYKLLAEGERGYSQNP